MKSESRLDRDVASPQTFRIGGEFEVRRLGFGALRIAGPGFWGEPVDPPAARRLLRQVVRLGVNLIDTADSYGPETSERLIRESLYPYAPDLVIATKGGLIRPNPRAWVALGRPEYLIHTARLSARRLGLATIPLWQLHRIDRAVPRDEQFDALKQLQDEGVIRHIGLSEVGVEDVEAARARFVVATVQSNYSLADRRNEPMVAYCEAHNIGFMAFFPLGMGRLAQPGSALAAVARSHGATPAQIALAWLLRRSPVVLPIPGTSSVDHLRENVAAAAIELSDEEFVSIGEHAAAQG